MGVFRQNFILAICLARCVRNVLLISIMAAREKPVNAAKSKPKKSKYIDTLNGEALARYNKKLELIDGVHPYQINKKDWSSDKEKLPAISYPDLLSYLLFTPSPYSKEDLKAIKSTETYNERLMSLQYSKMTKYQMRTRYVV